MKSTEELAKEAGMAAVAYDTRTSGVTLFHASPGSIERFRILCEQQERERLLEVAKPVAWRKYGSFGIPEFGSGVPIYSGQEPLYPAPLNAEAIRLTAIEECAKVCENYDAPDYLNESCQSETENAALQCASAIRALAGKP